MWRSWASVSHCGAPQLLVEVAQNSLAGLGQALLRAGEAAEALACVDSALAAARSIDAALIEFTALLMCAACLLGLQQTAQALPALQPAWAAGAQRDCATTVVWWLPEVKSALASSALAQDIEAPYVRRFVRRHALPGPDPLLADWPWPQVLRGLGEFDALLQDAPLQRAAGKTAQRPLDLRRALPAHGSVPLPVSSVAALGVQVIAALPGPLDFSRFSYTTTVAMARPAFVTPRCARGAPEQLSGCALSGGRRLQV